MEFRILGPIEVVGDGGAVALGGPQQRKVLAVLLSDPGRILTYDRLVEVLWPENDDPATARRSAITYVSRLRAAIGEGVVQTTDAGYVVDAGAVSVDADRFVALLDQARSVTPDRAVDVLDEALSLWRGPVFGDLSDEWWARPVGKKLEELRLNALAERIDALTMNGWEGRAIAEATSLLDAHPLREQFVEKAMRGLHAVGQTADALRVFQRYRSELAEQTGLDPSSMLTELESSMARGAALEPTSADIARPLRGYILRELLGEGSFGAVYRATQPGVGRDVAVKVIRPELADDRSFVRRFEAEAQLVARLEHPHIVPLYDFWRQPGGAFLVFRLMRGGSADSLVAKEGPLTLERAGAVLCDIGGALAAAHAENVVHRDVKPANILFDDAGAAYLADFGIAASLAGEPMVPQRWSAGSVLYASPEQLRDGVEDTQADQYALAVTIWELLTGRSPFAGEDASSVVAAKLREPLGPVDEFCPRVPPGVSAVLSRAGAVHPLDRFPSIDEFVVAWQRAASGSIARDTDPTSVTSDVQARTAAATMLGVGRHVVNPYKGLRAFREGDAGEFHGRGEHVERLAGMVASAPFVAVVGPSGSGKSSLVLAGLVPRLRAADCLVATMTPGESPLVALSSALSQIALDEQADLLSPAALRRPEGVRAAIVAIAAGDELVIVIDQLEELWTLAGEEDRRRFLAGLIEPIEAGFVRIVGTVRADFFDRPLADPVLGPLASKHTFGVTPMTAAELHDAITLPADQVGIRFEPALVSQLVAETIDQPGSLPLLQFTLAELFEGRTGAVITADAYNELGGLAGSLSRQAEEIYQAFGSVDRAGVRRMFSRLVAPGEGSEDTRRRVAISDLAGVTDHVIDAFVNRRLLTSDRDRISREPTVEVAHEVLLRSWPRLRGWLTDDRSWLRELRALSAAAALWDAGGRDEGDLYRGARLAVVGELAATHEDALTDAEQRFLAESLDQGEALEREARRRLAETTRQNRRLRRSLVGIGLVLAVAVAAGAVAVVQRQRADRQQRIALEQKGIAEQQKAVADTEKVAANTAAGDAEQAATQAQTAETASKLTTLASRSLSARSSQRDLAALLAVEAWKRAPDASSKSALFGTFTFDQGFLGYLRFDGANGANGALIPGTTSMLITTYSRDDPAAARTARVIDTVTGATLLQLDPLLQVPVVAMFLVVSANGQFGAEWGAGADGSVAAAAFDLSTGHMVGQAITTTQIWFNMAVDATGTRLALATDGRGAASVYDTSSGSELAHFPGLVGAPEPYGGGFGGDLAYGPDGRFYLGSTGERLRVFDPVTFAETDEITVPTRSTSGWIRFSADGTTIIARGVFAVDSQETGIIARIDVTTGSVLWEVSGKRYDSAPCDTFAFSVATDQLWCGGYFGQTHERSMTTGEVTEHVLPSQKGGLSDLDLVALPTGTMLVALGSNDGVLGRWRIDGGGPIQRVVAPGKDIVSDLVDGKTLLVGTPNGKPIPFSYDYSFWDLATGAAVPGFPSFLYANSYGHMLYGLFDDFTFGTYDVNTGERRSFAPGALPDNPISEATSSDGTLLLLGFRDGHAVEYETSTGRVLQTVQVPKTSSGYQSPVDYLALSADHSRIYVSGQGLHSFDAASGDAIAQNNDGAIGFVAVGPSGVVIASSYDGSLGIFDPDTLVQQGSLTGARGYIQQTAFSDDGTLMLAGGNDGSVLLFDLESRTRLGDPIETGLSHAISLRSDGHEAAIGFGVHAGVGLWSLEPDHWVTAACAIAGRNLTTDEWSTYIGDLGDYEPTCPEFPAAETAAA